MSIDLFRGDYGFLSNFSRSVVDLDGRRYPTVENAYQASKFPCADRERFEAMSPSDAKRAGKGVKHGSTDDAVRIMRDLVAKKFAPGTELASKLLSTNDEELVEGNTWGDVFWGRCRGTGMNVLGQILMAQRDALKGRAVREPVFEAPHAPVAPDDSDFGKKRLAPEISEEAIARNWAADHHSQAMTIVNKILMGPCPGEWPPVSGTEINRKTMRQAGEWMRSRISDLAPEHLRSTVAHEMNVLIGRLIAANLAKETMLVESRNRELELMAQRSAAQKLRRESNERQRQSNSDAVRAAMTPDPAAPVSSQRDAGLQSDLF